MFEFNQIFINQKLQKDCRISCLYWKPQISRQKSSTLTAWKNSTKDLSKHVITSEHACFMMCFHITQTWWDRMSLHSKYQSPSSQMSTNLDRQHSGDAGVSQRTGQTSYYHTIKISQKADGCVFCIPASVITAPTWRDSITSHSVNVKAAKAGPDYLSKQITWASQPRRLTCAWIHLHTTPRKPFIVY